MSKLDDLRGLSGLVNEGLNIARSVSDYEAESNNRRLNQKDAEIKRRENELKNQEAAFNAGKKSGAASTSETRFTLKEIPCPNCGAQMKPSDFSRETAALGTVNCPYCGSQIVLNDEAANAEAMHNATVEKQKTEIEAEKIKLEQQRAKAEADRVRNQQDLDMVNKVTNGIGKAAVILTVVGCVFILFIVLIILLIVWKLS